MFIRRLLGRSSRSERVRLRQLRQEVRQQDRPQQPPEEGSRPGVHLQLPSLRQQVRQEEGPFGSLGGGSRARGQRVGRLRSRNSVIKKTSTRCSAFLSLKYFR